MRRASKIDENQPEIIAALRDVGATVVSLAPVGGGVPDLLVGFRGVNYLIEVKDGGKVPSARLLTPAQQALHEIWEGQIAVCETVGQALKAIGADMGLANDERW